MIFRFHIKQVIISCEFIQHFNYLKVLLCSWMSRWCLDILVTWIEVLNHRAKIIVFKKNGFLRFCGMTLIRYCWESTCEQENGLLVSTVP